MGYASLECETVCIDHTGRGLNVRYKWNMLGLYRAIASSTCKLDAYSAVDIALDHEESAMNVRKGWVIFFKGKQVLYLYA